MSRIVYVNGEYLPEEQGKISIFDRGFLFADGVYEVSAVLRGRLVDNEAHLKRLHRSLGELNIPQPVSDDEIVAAQKTLVERNGLEEGLVYLQITRGPADRDFAFPASPEPTLVMFTQQHTLIESPAAARGLSIRTVEDIRWKRRDIKTVGLLAPSMAKQAALDAGADDAWMVEDGYVTEGTSNNAFIVTRDNVIRTRQLSNLILHGITRAAVLRLAEGETISIEEGAFTPEDAYQAREAFITSATAFAMPVVKIDDHVIGDGRPGPLVTRLRQLYIEAALGN
jgi:D-alanine transaminase